MTKVENKADWFDRIAWGVVIPVFLLAVISLYGIWVATVNDPKMGSPVKAVITQGVWYLVSIALVIFVMQFDAEQLLRLRLLRMELVLFCLSRFYSCIIDKSLQIRVLKVGLNLDL